MIRQVNENIVIIKIWSVLKTYIVEENVDSIWNILKSGPHEFEEGDGFLHWGWCLN